MKIILTPDASLFGKIDLTPAMQALHQRVEKGGVLSLDGVCSASQPFLAGLVHQWYSRRPIVVVTPDLKSQETFHQDLETWLPWTAAAEESEPNARSAPPVPLHFYPDWEILPHESKLPHADVISDRLATLIALNLGTDAPAAGNKAPVIVTNVIALMQPTFSPQALRARTRLLKQGAQLDPLELAEWLEEMGYDSEAQVTQKGEIALRGGILDVYPLTSPWPVRLEFFGDELESLRYFDPFTQISEQTIDQAVLPPAGELGLLKQSVYPRDHDSEALHQQSGVRLDQERGSGAGAMETETLLGYLPQDALFLLCEPDMLADRGRNYAGQLDEEDPLLVSWEEFQERLEATGTTRLLLSESDPPASEAAPEFIGSAPPVFPSLEAFRPSGSRAPDPQVADARRREFFAQLHRWLRQGYRVHVFCNNDGERQRFEEIWNEFGYDETRLSDAPQVVSEQSVDVEEPARSRKPGKRRRSKPPENRLNIHLGTLSGGFMFEPARLVVVTDAEIFGRYKVLRPRRLKSPHARAVRSELDINFTEFEEGDYVVHLQHGIGRYLGLKVLPGSAGTKTGQNTAAAAQAGQECLVLEYAPRSPDLSPPKLYVPVTEAHLVSKYVGAGKARPALNTLGGSRWAKTKAQAESAVHDLAGDLLSIQAARDSQTGHAFGPDLPWQREFESAFLYEETGDQIRAIAETKADLEKSKPMDRLICGDVGFGKTEVAIRAAFKAVLSGKQVALLVPTTVLAQQHYNTFRERMADYPVRVELLSRFRSRREQQRVIADLAAGSVDIVIGTHRLLQKDIAFKDLGLVVVDEEQRFGVLHKERFKQLRKLVDVLTLSATPIPRTLYLALTGARDMSTIETPPQDRLPVETIVTQYDERVIRDAIQRELNRGGQVFFLHNRVTTINTIGERLKTLVPHARLVIGHGQMESDHLEEVMTRFINGEADVLLSTTIIESGVDIPNANTIIIDRADRFGLSDLYQLRGRVGRYKHQAYAYLLLPRHATLLNDVRKRISAIKQYSSLGSGFKIAMRDLEIRGAGNLLGHQQSGHITAVGFELYCQLLKQSISRLKGEPVKPRITVHVRLDFLAFNPAEAGQVDPDQPQSGSRKSRGKRRKPELEIQVPREVAVYVGDDDDSSPAEQSSEPIRAALPCAPACIPYRYIRESSQRIEVYRKLAETTDKTGLESLRNELRDRYGPIPTAVELLLQVAELKILAADRKVTDIESRGDQLRLTRNNDFIMVGGKFPRLTKKTAKGRLTEIKKFLLAL